MRNSVRPRSLHLLADLVLWMLMTPQSGKREGKPRSAIPRGPAAAMAGGVNSLKSGQKRERRGTLVFMSMARGGCRVQVLCGHWDTGMAK